MCNKSPVCNIGLNLGPTGRSAERGEALPPWKRALGKGALTQRLPGQMVNRDPHSLEQPYRTTRATEAVS